MTEFKGIKQVLAGAYSALTEEQKKGYIWFVRTTSDGTKTGTTTGGDVFYGTRHYGSLNDTTLSAKVKNIIDSLQTVVDQNGTFTGFDATHVLLKDATNLTELFEALETAIVAAQADITALETAVSKKLDTVTAKDNSVSVDVTAPTAPAVSVKLSGTADNTLVLSTTVGEEGLYVAPTKVAEYVVVKNTESIEGLASQYWLTKEGVKVGATIDIPKDQFLKESKFIASATQDDVDIDPTVVIGDPYLRFIFQTTTNDKIVYVPVKRLVDVYEAGDGLTLEGNVFKSKIDAASEAFLTVSADGIKLSGVQTAIDIAKQAAIDSVTGAATADYNTLEKVEAKVKEAQTAAEVTQAEVNVLKDRVTSIETILTVTGDDVE